MKKMNGKVIFAALVGTVIGAGGAAAIYSQQAKVAPGYVIAEVEVTDPGTFQKYAEQVPGTLAPFGGHFLIRGDKITPLEGEAPKRLTVIAFESAQKAKAWEDSTSYGAIRLIRQSSAKSRIFIVEGVTPQ
ncbi:MAG: DUF1330 domain-containing protein [Candidatus Acidiferrales bacterium]